MIHVLVHEGGEASFQEYLEDWGAPLAARMRLVHYEELPELSSVPAGTWILTSLDALPPAVLDLAAELCGALRQGGCRVLNVPGETLLRYDLLSELHRRGRNRFRAVRARNGVSGLRFPVFVREENRHWASLTPLLRDPAELRAGLGDVIARGHRLEDLLVVEFCDTADAQRIYRKYAAFVVGSEIIPRHLSSGVNWSLKHRRSDFSEALVLEERDYLLTNPHERELREIFALARVQYGRIDYALLDGAIQTWEINLNPIIGRGRRPSSGAIPEELQPLRQAGKEHFYRRFREAFEKLDLGDDRPAIPLSFDPATLRRARGATRRARAQGRWKALDAPVGPLRRLRGRIASWLATRRLA